MTPAGQSTSRQASGLSISTTHQYRSPSPGSPFEPYLTDHQLAPILTTKAPSSCYVEVRTATAISYIVGRRLHISTISNNHNMSTSSQTLKQGTLRRQTMTICIQLQHPFVVHTCRSGAHASLSRANPPAFRMARHNSPAVRWSGFSFRSFAIACTSSPYLPTRGRNIACSPVEANLAGRARRSCDISFSAVEKPRLSASRRQQYT